MFQFFNPIFDTSFRFSLLFLFLFLNLFFFFANWGWFNKNSIYKLLHVNTRDTKSGNQNGDKSAFCKIYMQYSQLPLVNWHLYKLDTSLRQTPVFHGHCHLSVILLTFLWFFNYFLTLTSLGKSVNTTEKSTLKLVKLLSLKVICWKRITFKFANFSNVKDCSFQWCRRIFLIKWSIQKVEKTIQNVYSFYKTVRTLRGTKNTFETINGQ